MTEHGHERHESRATHNQQQRPAVLHSPVQVAAYRAAQLELVANPKLLRALGLVAALGGKADIDVLTNGVPGPTRHTEQDGLWRETSPRSGR